MTRPKQLINYSEFNTLTDCERRFVYQYLLAEPEPGEKRGLHLGTLCHLWHSSWLRGNGAVLLPTWTDDINTGGKPGEVRTLSLEDFDPALVQRAEWLAARFTAVYGQQPPPSWTVISAEEWMTRQFDWGILVGRTDGYVEIDGHPTLIEVKSYGSRPGPLAYAQVSPQLGCYSLLAEEKYGERPWGIRYQGIYTYQWKPKLPTQQAIIDEALTFPASPFHSMTKTQQRDAAREILLSHPGVERAPEESFDDLEVELGDEHLNVAGAYLGAAIRRRKVISKAPSPLYEALPSIGQHCRNCGFKPRCWFELGGVEEFEIEVDDDELEPV
jgi:PD-(D/E)XK nuclease superfamily